MSVFHMENDTTEEHTQYVPRIELQLQRFCSKQNGCISYPVLCNAQANAVSIIQVFTRAKYIQPTISNQQLTNVNMVQQVCMVFNPNLTNQEEISANTKHNTNSKLFRVHKKCLALT